MSRRIRCLVLTPVGPKSNPDYVKDTIHSFLRYMPPDESVMLLLDDTHSESLRQHLMPYENVSLLSTENLLQAKESERKTSGRLFVKQMLALNIFTHQYDWECLMRLDDDALIIGQAPHNNALAIFKARDDIGMLGAYLRRGDGSNKEDAMFRKGRQLIKQVFSREGLRNLEMTRTLAGLIARAKKNSYRLGDMCTGGAFFMSRNAYDIIQARSCGRLESLQSCCLDHDLLFALHMAAAGFKFMDFSDPDQVMAINWRGLPMPLEELVRRGKKVVHPVKEPDNPLHERDVRSFFRQRRNT
jgi:hypothetical protein